MGNQGNPGNPGPVGTARAYGSVGSCTVGTTCTVSNGANATVTHPFTGIFCIAVPGVSPSSTGVIATTETNLGAQAINHVPSGSCTGARFGVQTLSGGGKTDEPFFFAIP